MSFYRRPDTLYMLRCDGSEPRFKVGITCRLDKRVRDINNSSAFPVELVGSVEGSVEEERRVHAFLRPVHSHAEWFKDSSLTRLVARWFSNGSLPFSVLPEPIRIDGYRNGVPRAVWKAAA